MRFGYIGQCKNGLASGVDGAGASDWTKLQRFIQAINHMNVTPITPSIANSNSVAIYWTLVLLLYYFTPANRSTVCTCYLLFSLGLIYPGLT